MTLAALVAGLSLIGMLLAYGLIAINPRDPLLRDERPWSCSRCERGFANQTAFLTHECCRAVR